MALGGMTVGEMLRRMLPGELDDWLERMSEEPIGQTRDDLRFAKIGTLVGSMLAKDGRRAGREISKFMSDYGTHREPARPEDMQLFFQQLTRAFGGRVVDGAHGDDCESAG